MAKFHTFPLSDALGAAIDVDNLNDYSGEFKDFTVILNSRGGVVHAEVRPGNVKVSCKFCADEAAFTQDENP